MIIQYNYSINYYLLAFIMGLLIYQSSTWILGTLWLRVHKDAKNALLVLTCCMIVQKNNIIAAVIPATHSNIEFTAQNHVILPRKST